MVYPLDIRLYHHKDWDQSLESWTPCDTGIRIQSFCRCRRERRCRGSRIRWHCKNFRRNSLHNRFDRCKGCPIERTPHFCRWRVRNIFRHFLQVRMKRCSMKMNEWSSHHGCCSWFLKIYIYSFDFACYPFANLIIGIRRGITGKGKFNYVLMTFQI